MVLERLFNPKKLEDHPWELVGIGTFYASVGLLFAYILYPELSSMMALTFVVMLSLPFMYFLIASEEKKYHALLSEWTLLRQHMRTFKKYMYLFIGLTLGFTLWKVFSPEQWATALFSTQTAALQSINGITGDISNILNNMMLIFLHNTKIVVISFFLSFFFGAGAIFILTWNASIIAVALGTEIKGVITQMAGSSYIPAIAFKTLAYMTHGLPEILAYIIAGLAGGIISYAIIREDIKLSSRIMKDSAIMFAISLGLLFIAAYLEVFISPSFL